MATAILEADTAPAESVKSLGGLSAADVAGLAAFGTEDQEAPTTEAGDEPKPVLSKPEVVEVEPGTVADPEETEPEPEKEGEQDARPTRGLEHRVNQLTARAKSAEERVQALEAELEKAKTPKGGERGEPDARATQDPLLNHAALRPIVKEMTEAQATRDGAEMALDQFEDDPDAVVARLVELKCLPENTSTREARTWLRQQSRLNSDKLASARVRLETRRTEVETQMAADFKRDRAETAEIYAWHDAVDSEEHKMAQAYVNQFPGIITLPNHRTLLGRLVEGEKLERARKGAKTKTAAPTPPTPPRMAGASTAMPGAAPKPDPGSTAMKQAKKTGQTKDVALALDKY